MKINLQSKNIELTEAIKDYVLKKVTNLEKLLSKFDNDEKETTVSFEVSKSTNHHKSGEFFHSDCLVNIHGEEFYSSSDKEDLYQAIDDVREKLFSEISKNQNKKRTLFHRGARSVKNILKGLTNWNN